MTVCIGAVCDGGKSVVVAADRMMTYGAPINLQVEMAVKKIVPVNDSCVILFSGSVADGEEIIGRTKRRSLEGLSIGEIAQIAASCYQEVKNQRVEETILKPLLGIGFAGFPSVRAQSGSSQIMGQVIGM